MPKTTTVKILPNGNILIRRGSVEENDALLDAIKDMIINSSIGDLKKFFKSAEETKIIFGEEIFCG